MSNKTETVKQFCMIQLQLLKDRKDSLRKELLNCKIQEEFLLKTIDDLGGSSDTPR